MQKGLKKKGGQINVPVKISFQEWVLLKKALAHMEPRLLTRKRENFRHSCNGRTRWSGRSPAEEFKDVDFNRLKTLFGNQWCVTQLAGKTNFFRPDQTAHLVTKGNISYDVFLKEIRFTGVIIYKLGGECIFNYETQNDVFEHAVLPNPIATPPSSPPPSPAAGVAAVAAGGSIAGAGGAAAGAGGSIVSAGGAAAGAGVADAGAGGSIAAVKYTSRHKFPFDSMVQLECPCRQEVHVQHAIRCVGTNCVGSKMTCYVGVTCCRKDSWICRICKPPPPLPIITPLKPTLPQPIIALSLPTRTYNKRVRLFDDDRVQLSCACSRVVQKKEAIRCRGDECTNSNEYCYVGRGCCDTLSWTCLLCK
jgi:hypothetical protein